MSDDKIRHVNPKAFVIMVTGDLTSATENKLKMLNATDIVYKPYDIKKIMAIVNGLSMPLNTN